MTSVARDRGRAAEREREQLLAVPLSGAARLVGVSERRLLNWDELDLVRPTVKRRISPRNTVRLYGFQDLLSLLVVRELLREKMATQQIHRVVRHLRTVGYNEPLTQLKWATEAGQICFQHPDGTWEGDKKPDQIVLHQVLDLRPLRAQIWESVKRPRPPATAGTVERRRKIHGRRAVFAGTRIPVTALFPYLERGATTAEILEAFPDLRPKDVTAARREARSVSA